MLIATGAVTLGLDESSRRSSESRVPRAWFVLAGMALGLCAVSKPPSAVLFAGLLLAAGFLWPGLARRQRGTAVASVLVGGGVVGVFHAVLFQSPVEYLDAAQQGLVSLTTLDPVYGWGLLGRSVRQLAVLCIQIVDRSGWWYLLCPVVTLLVGGLTAEACRRSRLLGWLMPSGISHGLWLGYRSGDHLGGVEHFALEGVIYLSWATLLIVAAGCAAFTVPDRFRDLG